MTNVNDMNKEQSHFYNAFCTTQAQKDAYLASLPEPKKQTITIKASKSGGVSVYGLGRFPITLYMSQWISLLGVAKDILAFIEANKHLLRSKGDPKQDVVKAA